MFDDVLIHLGILTDHIQFNILIKLSGYIEYDSLHLLEYVGKRHHTHRHDDFLQLGSDLGKLSGCLLEIGKFESGNLQIRILQYHCLRDYKFADQIHQRIHLFHIHTDDALLLGLILRQGFSFTGLLGLDHVITGLRFIFLLIPIFRLLFISQIDGNRIFPPELCKRLAILSLGKFIKVDFLRLGTVNQLYDFFLGTLRLQEHMETFRKNDISARFIGEDIIRRIQQIFRHFFERVSR